MHRKIRNIFLGNNDLRESSREGGEHREKSEKNGESRSGVLHSWDMAK